MDNWTTDGPVAGCRHACHVITSLWQMYGYIRHWSWIRFNVPPNTL